METGENRSLSALGENQALLGAHLPRLLFLPLCLAPYFDRFLLSTFSVRQMGRDLPGPGSEGHFLSLGNYCTVTARSKSARAPTVNQIMFFLSLKTLLIRSGMHPARCKVRMAPGGFSTTKFSKGISGPTFKAMLGPYHVPQGTGHHFHQHHVPMGSCSIISR